MLYGRMVGRGILAIENQLPFPRLQGCFMYFYQQKTNLFYREITYNRPIPIYVYIRNGFFSCTRAVITEDFLSLMSLSTLIMIVYTLYFWFLPRDALCA